MARPIIEIEGLGKSYRIGTNRERYLSLREEMAKQARGFYRGFLSRHRHVPRDEEFWALRDVSLSVNEGETVGIIGRNGGGKSTLLKILSKITPPTTGNITLRGRTASLLEVGTGFHPELTGRENIYLNGAILGMTRTEIRRKFDEIVAFAEVEKFLDTPVKHFSSGMYVRLAFAVAAHLEPEILVVDEVLAVGDAQFQKKCLGKMSEVAKQGRTILFVSHIMATIRSLTEKCILLDRGKMSFFGFTSIAIDRYLSGSLKQGASYKAPDLDSYRRGEVLDSPVKFRRVWLTGSTEQRFPSFMMGEALEINCELECLRKFETSTISIGLTNHLGERVVTVFSMDQGVNIPLEPGLQQVTCRINKLPLSPGRYSITLGVNETANTTAFDVLLDYPGFEVVLKEQYSGELVWPHRPWGAVHWNDNTWKLSRNSAL